VIASIIRASIKGRNLVIAAALVLTAIGIAAVRSTPIDALPDLSDVQVVIRTSYPGQAPQIVENQVTYPLTTTMLSVPGAQDGARLFLLRRQLRLCDLRGRDRSLLGTQPRARIFESGAGAPAAEARAASLGPDATGVGWVYEYALVDRTGRHDLSQLRGLAGLVPALRIEDRDRRRRGRKHRWHGQAIPGVCSIR
jgi:Cu(I)/Ag(I) efflux system membrane protein CusA/SilA